MNNLDAETLNVCINEARDYAHENRRRAERSRAVYPPFNRTTEAKNVDGKIWAAEAIVARLEKLRGK